MLGCGSPWCGAPSGIPPTQAAGGVLLAHVQEAYLVCLVAGLITLSTTVLALRSS